MVLKLDDYWCEPKTIEQIREHSIQNKSPQGDIQNGCWVAKQSTVTFPMYSSQ